MERYALLFSCASASRRQASLAWSNCLAFLKATAARNETQVALQLAISTTTTSAREFSHLQMQTDS